MIVEHLGTWIGAGCIVELWQDADQREYVVVVYGREGMQVAEVRVSDFDSVPAVVTAILESENLDEL